MRRTIYLLNFILIASILFFGCEKSDESPVLTKIEPSVLDHFPTNIMELKNPKESGVSVLFTITWTETTFYLDNSNKPFPVGPVTYSLEIDREGNNFKNAYVLTVTDKLYANIMTETLNNILVKEFGNKPEESVGYEFRVVTIYGEENMKNSIASTNSLPAAIAPYFPPKEIEPIYIV